MKIDLVITELNVGGAEKALTRLAIGLHHRNHDVRVLSIGSEPTCEHHGLVDQLRASQVPVAFGHCDSARQFLRARRWLGHQFRTRPADIRQSFLFHANCLMAAASDPKPHPRLIGGIRVAENRPLRCMLESLALRRMHHVVCVSEAVRTFSARDLRVPPERLSVIPNGVQIDNETRQTPFDWTAIGFPADSRVILFVGRLHPQKGLELLQQQTAPLLDSDPRLRMVLIGEGPLEASLQSWADNLPADRVRLLPFQTDLVPYYLAAEVLVLPSHYEGMPNVILEAMAFGRAVVCSRIEGTAELFPESAPDRNDGDESESTAGDRRQRQTFEKGDGDAMLNRLLALLDDDALRRSLGNSNRRYVQRFLTVEKMVDRYESLYESLRGQPIPTP